ncbi:hypothetical protein PBY51_016980 [Eleginops maclovinus]|uniref:Uncharacterized protein n=1 Tax=Eleginops maclovinus TaxID=56733 RepID=A0AAN8AAJ8_ELEMC|nr:hypothetical protein PBY51_016980 [Eleginops maclovinus]
MPQWDGGPTSSDSAWDNQRRAETGITLGRVARGDRLCASKVTGILWEGGVLAPSANPAWDWIITDPARAPNLGPLTSHH